MSDEAEEDEGHNIDDINKSIVYENKLRAIDRLADAKMRDRDFVLSMVPQFYCTHHDIDKSVTLSLEALDKIDDAMEKRG